MNALQDPSLSLKPADDEVLVRECRNGNEEAWDTLIDKYKNLIFSIPIRLGLPNDDAQEIFQEVCLKLLSELPRLREPRSLTAWLMRVTANECCHWQRTRARQFAFHLGDRDTESLSSSEIPDGFLVEMQREQVVRDAISELADRCRELIEMLFFSSPAVPYETVAKRLGLATGSIGFIRMRCLLFLRRMLEEKGFE